MLIITLLPRVDESFVNSAFVVVVLAVFGLCFSFSDSRSYDFGNYGLDSCLDFSLFSLTDIGSCFMFGTAYLGYRC